MTDELDLPAYDRDELVKAFYGTDSRLHSIAPWPSPSRFVSTD